MPEHKPLSDEALDEMQRYYHVDSLEARAAANLRALRKAVRPLADAWRELPLPHKDDGPLFSYRGRTIIDWGDLRRLVACLPKGEAGRGQP